MKLAMRRARSTFQTSMTNTLTTATEGDGALPGDYKVVVSASTVDMRDLAKQQGGLVHQGGADTRELFRILRGARFT